jgi:protein arginine kinase
MRREKVPSADVPVWLLTESVPTPVVSTRIRLARNLADMRFPAAADESELNRAVEMIRGAIRNQPDWIHTRIQDLNDAQRALWMERGLISAEAVSNPRGLGLACLPDESASILMNEEDHCRIQILKGGFNLAPALEAAMELDQHIGGQVKYAVHPKLGYLTSFPTNVGTGLRVSVLLHLPALTLTREINEVLHAVVHVGLSVRGLYGQGADVHSAYFQIGNQITLGRTETEIIKHLEGVVQQVAGREEKACEKLLREQRVLLEDKVARASGILANCRLLGLEETLDLLSALQLGLDTGLISKPSPLDLKTLLWLIQPAHLQQKETELLTPEQVSARRADLVRRRLKIKAVKL